MCAVSMITDHYRDKWPVYPAFPAAQPAVLPPMDVAKALESLSGKRITLAEWEEYQKLKRKAEEYDQRTSQPHCEKPGVAEWEAAVEAVLRRRGLIT